MLLLRGGRVNNAMEYMKWAGAWAAGTLNKGADKLCAVARIKTRTPLYLGGVFIVVGYLLFCGLGRHRAWDDEATTCVFAKTLVRTGKFSGWDGRNLFSFREGTLLYDDYRPRESLPHILLTALSFKLLGVSDWTARFPFVCCGLLALAVFWLVLNEVFPRQPSVQWYAFLLTAFSYSFLLSSRMARYYSLALLLMLVAYYLYLKLLRRPSILYFIAEFVALLLLFFCHGLIFICFFLSLVAVHLLFHRQDFKAREWAYSIGVGAIAAVTIIPYAVIFRIWERPDIGKPPLSSKPALIFWNFRELDAAGYFPFIAAALLLFFIIRYRRSRNIIPPVFYEWLTFIVLMTVCVSMFSFQTATWSGVSGGLADIRFLYPLLPFCAGCMAVFLGVLHRGFGAVFAAVVCALMLCSTLLTFNLGNQPVRWPLPGFIYEIHNKKYITPYDTAVACMRMCAAKDDVVYSLPEYTQTVFHLYVGDSLIMGSQLKRETGTLPVERLRQAGYPAYTDEYFPHWLVIFGMSDAHAKRLDFFSRGLYSYILDRHIGVFAQDKTRPELPWHSFVPVKVLHPNTGIFVFRRVEKAPLNDMQEQGSSVAASSAPSHPLPPK